MDNTTEHVRLVIPATEDQYGFLIEARVIPQMRGANNIRFAISAALTKWAINNKMDPSKLDESGFHLYWLWHHNIATNETFCNYLAQLGVWELKISQVTLESEWRFDHNLLDIAPLPHREYLGNASQVFTDEFIDLLTAIPVGYTFTNPADHHRAYRVAGKTRAGLTVVPVGEGMPIFNFPPKLVNYAPQQSHS